MGDRLELQWMFSAGELEQTPSVKLGMSVQNERSLRQKSILFILELARYLSCNHLVISSASIMFQRFMMCQAFQNHDRFIVCATCIFLAGKVEEQPKRLKDVVDVFLLIRSKVQNKFLESELKLIQDKILVAERILLQTLGFDLQIDHPYGYCMHLLKSHKASFTSELARSEANEEIRKELNEESRKEVKRLAMNFLTDSFRGVLCLEFNAEVIATAVTLLAVLSRGIPPPTMANRGGVFRKSPGSVPTTTWTELFLSASKGNVSEIELKTCCSRVIEVYEDKVVAIGGPSSDTIKENNLLRSKLEEESAGHASWLALPIYEESLETLSQVQSSVVSPSRTLSPPNPPPGAASRPLNRAPPPPPPPARRLAAPPSGVALAKMAPPPPSKAFAPATPDVLPPPTPENFPPPTPENLPPPTPECQQPPSLEHAKVPQPSDLCSMEVVVVSDLVRNNSTASTGDHCEHAKKRRAENRKFIGSSDGIGEGVGNNEHCGVPKDSENGNIINGRNDNETSPPKKYKM